MVTSIIANIAVVIVWMDLGKPMPWFVFSALGCGLAFMIHHGIVYHLIF